MECESGARTPVDRTQIMPPGCDGHQELVEKYMTEYPDEHINGEVALFGTKLGRDDIAQRIETFTRPYTRANLFEILNMCSGGEIGYVGW